MAEVDVYYNKQRKQVEIIIGRGNTKIIFTPEEAIETANKMLRAAELVRIEDKGDWVKVTL